MTLRFAWHCAHCNTPNFLSEHLPGFGQMVHSAGWHTPDGKKANPDDQQICLKCDQKLIASRSYLKSISPPPETQTSTQAPLTPGPLSTGMPPSPSRTVEQLPEYPSQRSDDL